MNEPQNFGSGPLSGSGQLHAPSGLYAEDMQLLVRGMDSVREEMTRAVDRVEGKVDDLGSDVRGLQRALRGDVDGTRGMLQRMDAIEEHVQAGRRIGWKWVETGIASAASAMLALGGFLLARGWHP